MKREANKISKAEKEQYRQGSARGKRKDANGREDGSQAPHLQPPRETAAKR